MAENFGSILNPVDTVTKFAPDRFRAAFAAGMGYASGNRFEVEFPSIREVRKPDGTKLEDQTSHEDRNMFCTAAGMPARTVSSVKRGYTQDNRAIATDVANSTVNFTFYLSNTYSMRNYFEEWIDAIHQRKQKGPQYYGYYDNYTLDVLVRQYTKNGKRVYYTKLIDAYPTDMGAIKLNNQLQTAVLEMTVTMQYRTYETEKQSLYSDIFG